MIRRSLTLLVLALSFVLATSAGRLVEADTVYLKNGSFINGVVISRENSLILRIGNVGQLEIPNDDVYKIEKNALTGAEGGVTVEDRESESNGDESTDEEATDDAPERDGRDGDEKSNRESEADENDGRPSSRESDASQAREKPIVEDEEIDPELEATIRKYVTDLESTNPKFRIRAERHLRSIGTPVVPFITPLLRAEGELVRIAVARILTEVGDERAIDELIEALLDSNEYVRDHANKALERVTREDFGYRPNASPRRREASRLKWAKWWQQEKEAREQATRLEQGDSDAELDDGNDVERPR